MKSSESTRAVLDALKASPSLKTQCETDKTKTVSLLPGQGSGDSPATARLKADEQEFQSRKPLEQKAGVIDLAGNSRSLSSFDLDRAKFSSDGKTVEIGDVRISASAFKSAMSQSGANASQYQADYKKWYAEGDQKGFVGGSKNEVHYVAGNVYRGRPE